MTIAETAERRRHTRSVLLVIAALLTLSGCATIRRHEAANTARLLTAAGFQMQPADSPERLDDLTTMPPFRIVTRSRDGGVVYSYADPQNCHCLYVGGPKEYSEYERLRLEQELARYRSEAYMNRSMWGGWW